MMTGYRVLFWNKWSLLLAVAAGLHGCTREAAPHFEGQTQGTTYHVTVVRCTPAQQANVLQTAVEQRLAQIDVALSNYRDDSELSRFNRAPIDQWIDLGPDLDAVLRASQQISQMSEGAFDITVAPLLGLWGFGPESSSQHVVPDDAAIAQARTSVGYQFLELQDTAPRARKTRPLTIDVNGIAQGYSVDQLANVLSARGCSDYLVEIGGELRLAGHNAENKPWRIAIERPSDAPSEVQQSLRGSGIAITTAGDYHDYFEQDGVSYSHTIDPRTGRPIAHKLASVTVIDASATQADGYDTVVEVLGPEEGFAFAQRHHLAAYFIVREGDRFVVRKTEAMSAYLE